MRRLSQNQVERDIHGSFYSVRKTGVVPYAEPDGKPIVFAIDARMAQDPVILGNGMDETIFVQQYSRWRWTR